MVVDAAAAPVLGLGVEDFTLGARRGVARAPQDTVRVRVFRRGERGDAAVVAGEGGAVVIPVGRHGEGIAEEGAEEGVALAVGGDGHERRVGFSRVVLNVVCRGMQSGV